MVYSPLVYKGVGVPLQIGYFNHKKLREYGISLQFSNTKLNSTLAKDGIIKEDIANYFDFVNLKLDFNYYRHVKDISGWQVYLGGHLDNFILYKNQAILYESWDNGYHIVEQGQWAMDIYSNLKIACNIQKQLNKKNLIYVDVSYPILSYVVGRVYAPNNFPEKLLKHDEDDLGIGKILGSGDFLTINKFVNFHFKTNYYRSLGKHTGLFLGYAFQYYQYPKLELVKNGMHTLLIGLTVKF